MVARCDEIAVLTNQTSRAGVPEETLPSAAAPRSLIDTRWSRLVSGRCCQSHLILIVLYDATMRVFTTQHWATLRPAGRFHPSRLLCDMLRIATTWPPDVATVGSCSEAGLFVLAGSGRHKMHTLSTGEHISFPTGASPTTFSPRNVLP